MMSNLNNNPNPIVVLENRMMEVECLIRSAHAFCGDKGMTKTLLVLAEEQMIEAFKAYYKLWDMP